MRMIDADNAKEQIIKILNVLENKTGSSLGSVKAVVKNALELEIITPTVGKWISVDDETPAATEEDMEGDLTLSRFVLVFLKYKSGFTFITVDKYRPDMDAWMSEVPGEGCKVTHWMELPAPPEVSK